MELLNIFEQIDTDFSGEITADKLDEFMKESDYDDTFIEKLPCSLSIRQKLFHDEEFFTYKKPYHSYVLTWLRLFDRSQSGVIKFDDFCEVLDIDPREEYMYKVLNKMQEAGREFSDDEDQMHGERKSSRDSDTMHNVRILKEDPDMDDNLKNYVIHIAKEAQHEFNLEKDIARSMKQQLDETYGRVWQCLVGRFQYGSFVSHEPGYFLHFWAGKYAVLVWRTPEY